MEWEDFDKYINPYSGYLSPLKIPYDATRWMFFGNPEVDKLRAAQLAHEESIAPKNDTPKEKETYKVPDIKSLEDALKSTDKNIESQKDDIDFRQLALSGGGALLAHALASSMIGEPSDDDKKKESALKKLWRIIAPLGAAGLGAYAGHSLGGYMKKESADTKQTLIDSAKAYQDESDMSSWRAWANAPIAAIGAAVGTSGFKDWRNFLSEKAKFLNQQAKNIDIINNKSSLMSLLESARNNLNEDPSPINNSRVRVLEGKAINAPDPVMWSQSDVGNHRGIKTVVKDGIKQPALKTSAKLKMGIGGGSALAASLAMIMNMFRSGSYGNMAQRNLERARAISDSADRLRSAQTN